MPHQHSKRWSSIAKTYAAGTLAVAALMLAALCWPAEWWPRGGSSIVAMWAVAGLAAVPLLGALATAVQMWHHDRTLSYAALLTLGGLGLVGASLHLGLVV